MTGAAFLATTTGPAGTHPLWHYLLVVGAASIAFAVIKTKEWMRDRGLRMPRPSAQMFLLAGLGLSCSIIHGFVCTEHFREWVVYGIFFLSASTVQAAWSIIVVLKPSRRLLQLGAAGNSLVIVTYFLSRLMGIPFGPEAFKPESFDVLGIAATTLEVCVVGLSLYLLGTARSGRHHDVSLVPA